jgi:hypothetical protein
MNISSKIAATVVAVVCLLALSSVPALALSNGNINMSFNTASSAPQIVTITPTATSMVCTPDGYTPILMTVTCFDAGGWQQLGALQAQVKIGTTNAGPVQTYTNAVAIDAKDATYAINGSAPYWWPHGTNFTVAFTINDINGRTGTGTSVALTYLPAAGITVETPSINFGTLNYSQTTPAYNASFHNSANTPISVGASGTQFVSDVLQASPVSMSALWGSSTTNPTPQQMSPIATLATSNVGTVNGGTIGFGTPPASVTSSWYVVVPPASPSFVFIGNYTATTVLTATSTG